MAKELMVARALESNSFQSTAASAAYINPAIWVSKIEEFATAKLVMAPLGKELNELLGSAGASLNEQFNVAITAAALTESTAITPSAISYTQVIYTPTEYGIAIALTQKQKVRPINDIMMEKTRDMGYALAKLKDSNVWSAVTASTVTNIVTPNSVAVSAIASSDTMNTDVIADGLFLLENADREGKYLAVHPGHVKALRKLSDFIDASVYGGREVVLNGEIGKYLGLRVLVSTQSPRNSTTSTAREAVILDDEAFGIAYKQRIFFSSDYKVLEREHLLAAVEDYQVKLRQADKVARIVAYVG